MRSEQLASFVLRARTGIRLASRIVDIERTVASSRATATGLAVAPALGDRLAPALDLFGALEARHQSRRRLVKRAPHIGVAGFRDAPLNVDLGAGPPASRRQPEVGRDVTRAAEARRVVDRDDEQSSVTGPTPEMAMKRWRTSLRTTIFRTTWCSRQYCFLTAARAASRRPSTRLTADRQLLRCAPPARRCGGAFIGHQSPFAPP